MRKGDWQITVIVLAKLYCLFLFENINFSIELFLLKRNFCRTFVIHLTRVTNKCRSLEMLHPLVNAFFFPAFLQFLQIINKSSPEPLVCSYPNSFSHLSKNWLCLPPFSWFIAVLQAHVSGHFTSTIYWSNNAQTWRSSFKSPGCVNRLQFPLCS